MTLPAVRGKNGKIGFDRSCVEPDDRDMKKTAAIALLVFSAACAKTVTPGGGGLVRTLQGSAELEHAGVRKPLKVGDAFESGDTIHTGPNGIVVVAIRGSLAQAEIQPNASFQVNANNAATEVNLNRGNAWLAVTKTSANEEFTVRTPTTIAGVRGTKFYTAQFEDIVAVCHCEGDVEFSTSGPYKAVHHTDTLVFTRKDGKTVTLTAKDVPDLSPAHNHSLLENSPLGRRDEMSEERKKKLLETALKKFAEMK